MTYIFLKNLLLAYLTSNWVPMRFVATSYALGNDVKKNGQRARIWYARAAKAGDLSSNFDLAMMLLNGEGGPVELERGKTLLEETAKNGEPQAQKVLAHAYKKALFGFPVDSAQAERWKQQAEAQGLRV
jgi:TPR repeat protein